MIAKYKGEIAGYVNVFLLGKKNGPFKEIGYSAIVDLKVFDKYKDLKIEEKLMNVAERVAADYFHFAFLLFAMSISTVESFLSSNSVIFTNDILPFFNKMFSKKTYVPSVFIARTATIFFCCLGVFISLQFKDLFSILLAFSNFYYPMAMIPYVILTLGLNFKKASIMSGIFSGILVTVVNYILTKNVNSYSIGLIAHLVGLFLTELYLRMKNKNQDTSAVEKTI